MGNLMKKNYVVIIIAIIITLCALAFSKKILFAVVGLLNPDIIEEAGT